jgi:hypothetical protein
MPRVRRPNTSASTCRRPERWATRDIDTPGQGQRGRAPTGSSRRLHPSAIGRVRSAGPVGTQPQQRRAQVRDEHPERPLECRGPADHYVVASFCRIRRQHDPGGLAKPSPNSVPRHCVADFAARRNPQPNIGRSLLHAIPIVWLQYLQDQPGRCPRAPFARDTHELGPTLQAWNNRWHGDSGGKALAPSSAPSRHDAAAADGRHAMAKSMPPFANDLARLISPLHERSPIRKRPRCIRAVPAEVNAATPALASGDAVTNG